MHPPPCSACIPAVFGHNTFRWRQDNGLTPSVTPGQSAVVQAASAVGASAAGAYFAGRPNILLLQNHGFLPSINLAGRL